MEGRRSDADDGGREDQCRIAVGHRETADASERDDHAERQQIGQGALVGIETDPWLQQRGGDLIDQRDPADLAEAQMIFILEHRVNRREHGLDQVVQKMREGDGADNLHDELRSILTRRGGRKHLGGGGQADGGIGHDRIFRFSGSAPLASVFLSRLLV